jgi:hypothetical protein
MRMSMGMGLAMFAAIGLFSLLESTSPRLQASVTAGSSVGVRAADFNAYGTNVDVGLVGQSVENFSGQAGHQAMRQAGVGWVRYWLSWQNAEPTATSYPSAMNWAAADYDINAAIAQGLNVYITIQSAPAWVHGGKNTFGWGHCGGPSGVFDPNYPDCGQIGDANPANDYAPFDPGGGNGQSYYWKRFVGAAVARYGDRVKYWGFWNEANSQWMWPEWTEAPCYNRGSQIFTKVIRPGRDAALAANPSIRIVGPDTDSSDWLDWMLTLEKVGQNTPGCVIPAGHTFDVISIHSYPWATGGVNADLTNFKTILDRYDRREVWWTEAATNGYMQQALDEFQKRGWIGKIFAFGMKGGSCAAPGDTNPHGPLGLLSSTFTPCASYNVLANFILANPPAMHFSELTREPGHEDYVLLQNPHDLPTTATLSFADGTGVPSNSVVTIGAHSRYTANPSFTGVRQALTVSTANPSLPVWAEHSHYWNSREAGVATQGASERSDTWYFAEGTNGSVWAESISAYNPSPTTSVSVTWKYINETGSPVLYALTLGPRASARVPTAIVPGVQASHGSVVSGVWSGGTHSGQPAPISAERVISWSNLATGAPNAEGHASKGVPFPSTSWCFAEGAQGGGWSSYVLLMNPTARTATVWVRYMRDVGGFTSWTGYTINPFQRVSVAPGVSGTFGIEVRSVGPDEVPIVAERAMYFGTGWTVGTVGEGASTPSQRWIFAEGSTLGGYFAPFFLLSNPSLVAANVTVNFRRSDGVVVPYTLTLNAGQRATVNPATVPSLVSWDFSTEVVVTSGVGSGVPPGIIAERAMYWPGSGWIAGSVALGMP